MEEILREIIKETTEQELRGKVFYKYVDKQDIAKKMLNELVSKKYSRKQTNKGFFLAENERNKIGLISQCLGLESLSLSPDFEYDLFDGDEKQVNEIKSIISETLKFIFDSLTLTEEKVMSILDGHLDEVTLTYDASPYIYNDDIDDESLHLAKYVDGMAKVLETFIEFRNLYYKLLDTKNIELTLEGVKDLSKWIDAIIFKIIHDLNNACIQTEEEITYKINKKVFTDRLGKGITFKGWNYIPMDSSAEPSLYFTYSVCSAYMSFYSHFQYILNALRVQESKYTQEQLAKCVIPEINIGSNNISMKRNYEFLKKFYPDYVAFNKRCFDAGHYVDYLINQNDLDITQSFIGQNFSEVTVDEILNSTTNDAMINTLLSILILIYSGVDVDYASLGYGEDFNDVLQYSVQNVLKIYKKIERANRNYIVDQYFLSFNEYIPSEHQEQVKLLRKQRILTMTLMPLLIKTYTAMSRYIINYPQKEMRDYLKYILINRCIDKNTNSYIWIWDKDGYNVGINLIYILNMLSFYAYYEKYEYPFTNDEESFNNKLSLKEQEHQRTMDRISTGFTLEVENLKKALGEANKSLKELKPIEKDIIAVVENYLNENMNHLIAEAFKKSRSTTIDSSKDDLAKSFQGMFTALFANGLKGTIDVGGVASDMKLSKNSEYVSNENTLFILFSEWIIDRLKKEINL